MKFGLYCKGSDECIFINNFKNPKLNNIKFLQKYYSKIKNLPLAEFNKLFEIKRIYGK